MFFEPSLALSASEYEHFPGGKTMARVDSPLARSHTNTMRGAARRRHLCPATCPSEAHPDAHPHQGTLLLLVLLQHLGDPVLLLRLCLGRCQFVECGSRSRSRSTRGAWRHPRVPSSTGIVPLQVQRLFESEGIFPDAYRIMEFQGSVDTFSSGRVVLKVHFSIPGQTEK